MIRISNMESKIRILSYTILVAVIILILRILFINSVGMYEYWTRHNIPNKDLMLRHNIVDRNNNILAISVPAYEFHINPAFIIDINTVIAKIRDIFPELDQAKLHERLKGESNGWFLIKDNISPIQKKKIIDSGIEGAFFREYYTRFYPYGNTFSHIVGHTSKINANEEGVKGSEKQFNQLLLKQEVQLSLDAMVQSIVRENLLKTLEKFEAKGAMAIIVDLETREIIASVSLPDFNPNEKYEPNSPSYVNQPFSSVFNLGSVFKVFTISLGLQNGFKPTQIMHLPLSIPVNKDFSVRDDHRSRDEMTLEEILAFSSNVGVAFVVQKVGFEKQRQFYEDIKMFEKPIVELPKGEIAKPIFKKGKWRDDMHYTLSYGYGVSISPAHFIQMAGGLAYDGKVSSLTLLKGGNANGGNARGNKDRQILPNQSILDLQQMLRSVVQIGTARRATINGYSVCGKTGTSEKYDPAIRGWSDRKKFLSFFSVFPCHIPKYAMYIALDEPSTSNAAFLQASNTVVQTSSDIIKVVAPILDIKPDNLPEVTPEVVPAVDQTGVQLAEPVPESLPAESSQTTQQKPAPSLDKSAKLR